MQRPRRRSILHVRCLLTTSHCPTQRVKLLLTLAGPFLTTSSTTDLRLDLDLDLDVDRDPTDLGFAMPCDHTKNVKHSTKK